MGCVDQRSGEVYRNKLQVLAQWNRNYGIEQVKSPPCFQTSGCANVCGWSYSGIAMLAGRLMCFVGPSEQKALDKEVFAHSPLLRLPFIALFIQVSHVVHVFDSGGCRDP